ncbi:polar growth protein [Tulasnella sp. 418]|nr:polar growth protein [Tulasnella sp. 418]
MTPVLDSLPEEPSNEATPEDHSPPIVSSTTSTPAKPNTVMAATLTDVQHAIDQLGVHRPSIGGAHGDDADRRTFSFASTRDGTDTENERDHDYEDEEEDESWRRTTRRLLAEKAQLANQRREELEGLEALPPPLPIPVEMSDESEDEEDDELDEDERRGVFAYEDRERDREESVPTTATQAAFPPHVNGTSTPNGTSEKVESPVPSKSAFSTTIISPIAEASPTKEEAPDHPIIDNNAQEKQHEDSSAGKPEHEGPVVPAGLATVPIVAALQGHSRAASNASATSLANKSSSVKSSIVNGRVSEDGVQQPSSVIQPTAAPVDRAPSPMTQQPFPVVMPTPETHQTSSAYPTADVSGSPAASSVHVAMAHPLPPSSVSSPVFPQPQQPYQAGPSTPTMPLSATTTSSFNIPVVSSPLRDNVIANAAPAPLPAVNGVTTEGGDPTEWSVEQVADWLRSKKFDEGVCSKFIENEISGDVLLELDANMLKELEITALGKRVKILNAIKELRRPQSTAVSDANGPSGYNTPGFNPGAMFMGQPGQPQYGGAPMMPNGSMPPYLSAQHLGVYPSQQYPPGAYPFPVDPSMTGAPSHGHARNLSYASSAMTGSFSVDNSAPGVNGKSQSLPLDTQSQQSNGSAKGVMATIAGAVGAGLGIAANAITGTGGDGDKVVNLGESGEAGTRAAKARPASLVISPSDGALGQKALWSASTSGAKKSDGPEDRGVVSDSEGAPKPSGLGRQASRRKAVRSISSQLTTASETKSDPHATTPSSSIPPSPSMKETLSVGGMFTGRRRNVTSESERAPSRASDRLSFFGTSLGKHRKPAPSDQSDTSSPVMSSATEKTNGHRTLSRLYLGGSQSKKGSKSGHFATGSISAPGSPEKPIIPVSGPRNSAPIDGILRNRSTSNKVSGTERHSAPPVGSSNGASAVAKPGATALEQIGEPDYQGWMRKRGDRYNTWKLRYFALKGPHLYYMKNETETKIKGFIDIHNYKVIADENVYPGRYGFRIVHETEKSHFFSSVDQFIIRDWMKALMKATIGRDYSRPVVSSCNIPTIPLSVAQAMNPAPRPPSPTARDATQRALRRENVNQLSSRDARVLMGLAGEPDAADKARLNSLLGGPTMENGFAAPGSPVPPRPSREMRRRPSVKETPFGVENSAVDMDLISWINTNLPRNAPPATDLSKSLSSGLILYRLAESIKGVPTDVPDSVFPSASEPDKLDGLFKLFDFLLDNDVRIGSVSINDLRQANRDKIILLVKSLKAWKEKRQELAQTFDKQGMAAGPFMAVG